MTARGLTCPAPVSCPPADVDGALLLALDEQDLREELSVSSRLQRKKILLLLAKLRSASDGDDGGEEEEGEGEVEKADAAAEDGTMLPCRDCDKGFLFTAEEAEFYAGKGYNNPVRSPPAARPRYPFAHPGIGCLAIAKGITWHAARAARATRG